MARCVSEMNKVVGFIRLLRPINGLMMGLAVIVGASLALAEPFSTAIALKLLFGFITAFALTGASMAINDYYDYEIDKINEPNRPVPSGTVKLQECLAFAFILILIGLTASAFTNPASLMPPVIAVTSVLISVTYVTKGKRTGLPGNFLVSACVAISFIYGSFVVDQGFLKVLLFAALAFLSNTGRELAKGIVDFEGDRVKGMRTVMVVHGPKSASILSSCFFLSAVFLSLVPWLLKLVSIQYVPFVIVTDVGFVASSVMLVQDPSRKNARRVKNLALVWMLFGMISFFAGTR
jgi:geranylgeranylglycerol-phosphate geranylgeranyltransferase